MEMGPYEREGGGLPVQIVEKRECQLLKILYAVCIICSFIVFSKIILYPISFKMELQAPEVIDSMLRESTMVGIRH